MSRRPSHERSSATGVQKRLERAVSLHQAGDIREARAIYQEIIDEVPAHFDATHLLGVIALQEGELVRAQQLIAAALRIKPNDTSALSNLGTAHLRDHEPERALEQFQRAVKLAPGSHTALTNLGMALRQLGRSREALEPLTRAHAADPTSIIVCNLLGACRLDTGDAHGALVLFEAATHAAPEDADGWSNLAIALNNTGQLARAQECADRAVALHPDSSAALAARAGVEFEQGEIEAAIATYAEAAALPGASVQTYCGFANALWTSGRCDEAIECLHKSVSIDGNNSLARWKLAMSHCRPYYADGSDIEPSRLAFADGLRNLQDWFNASPRPEAFSAVGTTQPFFIAYQPYNNRELLSQYGAVCCTWMAGLAWSAPTRPNSHGEPNSGRSDTRLRIGIVSAHVRNHSVWNAITKGWIQHLDRSRFAIHLFHLGRSSDAETAWARSEVCRFVDEPVTLPGWVSSIAEARLDALIYPDIGMDTLTTQLAALRLAPVQAASWGHPETSGLPTIDVYLSAQALEPENAQDNYSERLVCLPNLGAYVEPLSPPVVLPELASLGLPGNEPLLLCPGTPFKYSPLTDHIWARIAKGLRAGSRTHVWSRIADRLRGAKRGRLVFFRSGNATMDRQLAQRLRRAFDREGVDFDAHVCIISYLDRAGFYGLMQQSALMLDTVGFSGFNNTLQAIEAGLPVLAYEGAFLRGRLASGIMRQLQLPQLVASTDEGFIQAAVELTHDDSRRKELRGLIVQRRESLFRDVEPVRALERCLIEAIAKKSPS